MIQEGRPTESLGWEEREACIAALADIYTDAVAAVTHVLDCIRAAGELGDPRSVRTSTEELQRIFREELPVYVWYDPFTGTATIEPESVGLDMCRWCNDMVYEEAILCPSCHGEGLSYNQTKVDVLIMYHVSDVFVTEDSP